MFIHFPSPVHTRLVLLLQPGQDPGTMVPFIAGMSESSSPGEGSMGLLWVLNKDGARNCESQPT